MKKTLMGGGYIAPEMTLYAAPVEQGFFTSPGDGDYGQAGFGYDNENNLGEI